MRLEKSNNIESKKAIYSLDMGSARYNNTELRKNNTRPAKSKNTGPTKSENIKLVNNNNTKPAKLIKSNVIELAKNDQEIKNTKV